MEDVYQYTNTFIPIYNYVPQPLTPSTVIPSPINNALSEQVRRLARKLI